MSLNSPHSHAGRGNGHAQPNFPDGPGTGSPPRTYIGTAGTTHCHVVSVV